MLLTAWFGAHDGDPTDAAVNPGDGDLHSANNLAQGGDYVVIKGDWCYDAAHSGWNEFHPVKSVQKIPHAPYWKEGSSATEVNAFKTNVLDIWCNFSTQAGSAGVKNAQTQPENRWTLHPDVDGCQPPQIR
jgi:hypothetical protein